MLFFSYLHRKKAHFSKNMDQTDWLSIPDCEEPNGVQQDSIRLPRNGRGAACRPLLPWIGNTTRGTAIAKRPNCSTTCRSIFDLDVRKRRVGQALPLRQKSFIARETCCRMRGTNLPPSKPKVGLC